MKRALAATATAATAIAVLLAGCSPLTEVVTMQGHSVPACGNPDGVVLVVGAHRDTPAPAGLEPPVACLVAAAIEHGKPVILVDATGQPDVVAPRLLSVTGGTLAQQDSPRVAQDVQRVDDAVAGLRPRAPGVDDLAALDLAADAAQAGGLRHAVLVLLDSGLDDRGALSFTTPGMLAAEPSEVAGQLKATGNEPHLRGFTVELVGIGFTAPPQAPLDAKWRGNLTAIWQAVVTAAGAAAVVIPQPGAGASVRTREPVKLITVPAGEPVRPAPGAHIVFTGASPVRFEPNTTVFVDPAAAVRALRPIAEWLAANRSRHALLVGTTADVGPMNGQVALSRQRASRVRAVLVALGSSRSQITLHGVGSDFPQFVPDRNASGTLLAGPATLNRSVRITLSSSS
jgi:outer membrane protein OmpA-like peptidoglycan-associated protein